jgi:aldose 1-epimerase
MPTEDETLATALELSAGELRLALRPDLGGSIAGLWRAGLPVLRSTEPGALDRSRASACYPLAPYSNRLGYRRFRFHGQDHQVAANVEDGPHALHGVAWQRPWTVLSSDATHAEIAYRHEADAHWPFAFTVQQRFSLAPGHLRVEGTLHNDAPQPQPAGLGWHPYFPKRARSRLHAELSERWESDATELPTRRVPQPGIDGDVAHMAFDNCFGGWSGTARIRDEKLALKLSSSLAYLVVYTPPLKDYFCVEPVSHVSNAIHMASPAEHGLAVLMPGESLSAWWQLDITPV